MQSSGPPHKGRPSRQGRPPAGEVTGRRSTAEPRLRRGSRRSAGASSRASWWQRPREARRPDASMHTDGAVGYGRSYPWLEVPVLDAAGDLVHREGVTATPGLFALGLRCQRTRRSHFLGAVGDDAARIAETIVAGGPRHPAGACRMSAPLQAERVSPVDLRRAASTRLLRRRLRDRIHAGTVGLTVEVSRPAVRSTSSRTPAVPSVRARRHRAPTRRRRPLAEVRCRRQRIDHLGGTNPWRLGRHPTRRRQPRSTRFLSSPARAPTSWPRRTSTSGPRITRLSMRPSSTSRR